MIEPQIARLAAQNRTEVDILALEKNLDAFVNAESGSKTYAMLDLEYHKLISKATANPLIPLIMDPLFSLMPKVKTLIVSRLKHTKLTNATNYHQIIFDKIKNRDADGAYDAMTSHLQIAEQDTLKLMDSLEDGDELF
jgi:GntR family transcriptional repressor for pyruvate dehydrogenase complex